MDWLVVSLLVLGRIVAASWSNVLQKRSISIGKSQTVIPSPLELQFAVWGCMAIGLSPWWLASLVTLNHLPSSQNLWLWMSLACLFEAPGNFLLLRSLQTTDLSIFGPLASYKPLLGMLLGWLILAESPTRLGFLGTCILLGGSLVLSKRSPGHRVVQQLDASGVPRRSVNFFHVGVRDRLAGVALTAAGAVVMKLGMTGNSSISALAVWSLLGWLVTALWVAGHGRETNPALNATPNTPEHCLRSQVLKGSLARSCNLLSDRNVIAIAATLATMQGLTIVVFQQIAVGYALALFQLGSILTVYLGHQLFGESDLWRRLIAAAIMVLGAVLILVG